MNLVENKTKFMHKTMPLWGIGTLQKLEADRITINFENAGTKTFLKDSIGSKLMIIDEELENSEVLSETSGVSSSATYENVDNKNDMLVQYDGENDGIFDENIIGAFEGNDTVVFNETYTIVGKRTEAFKIHAMYDLVIIGDVIVQECIVNGSLTIMGNARISNLTCQRGFLCKGDVCAKKMYIGDDMIVNSVECDELICDGNVTVKTTANIKQEAQIAKTIVTYEGIMGAGKFTAQNAIANEYFEFEGEYDGRILELDTDKTISEPVFPETTEEVIILANKKLADEYSKAPSYDEEKLVTCLHSLVNTEGKELQTLPIAETLFLKLVDISYQSRIETIEDYLMVLLAQECLPDEIFSYESVDHIGKMYLPKARQEIIDLVFEPTSIKQFTQALSMAVRFEEELDEVWETLMDKIFESIGLKYTTVSSMLHRNPKKKTP